MSDRPTPMTDALGDTAARNPPIWEHARTLERQLAEAKEAMQAAHKLLHSVRRDHSAGMNLAAYECIQEAINHLTP